MSSKKESFTCHRNTFMTTTANMNSNTFGGVVKNVNSPRNIYFQSRHPAASPSVSASIQRQVIDLDSWTGHLGIGQSELTANMYRGRYGIPFGSDHNNIGFIGDNGFSNTPKYTNNPTLDNTNANNQENLSSFNRNHNNIGFIGNSGFSNTPNYTTHPTLDNTNVNNQENLRSLNSNHNNIGFIGNSGFSNTPSYTTHPTLDNTNVNNQENTKSLPNNVNFQETNSPDSFTHLGNIDLNNYNNHIDSSLNFNRENNLRNLDDFNDGTFEKTFPGDNSFSSQTQATSNLDDMDIEDVIPPDMTDIVLTHFDQAMNSNISNIPDVRPENNCFNFPNNTNRFDNSIMDIQEMDDLDFNIPSIRMDRNFEHNKLNEGVSQDINFSLTSPQTEPEYDNTASRQQNIDLDYHQLQQQGKSQLEQHQHQQIEQQKQLEQHQQNQHLEQHHQQNQQLEQLHKQQKEQLEQQLKQQQLEQQILKQQQQQQLQQHQQHQQQLEQIHKQQQEQQQSEQNQQHEHQIQSKESIELIENEDPEISDEIFDKNGDTFLHVAIHQQDMNQCLEILETPILNKAINVKNKSKEVPLLLVIKKCPNHCSLVLEKLLNLQVAVNVNDKSGNNLFHLAVSGTNYEQQCLTILEIVLKHEGYKEKYKTLLNQRNVAGQTPTHVATGKAYAKVIKMLHTNGADLDLKDFQAQKTCIVMAAEEENWSLVTELINLEANVNIPTKANQRAINYAIKSSREDIIELLFQKGTDVYNWKDSAPSQKIEKLVEKLIRRKRRKKKENKIERIE